MSSRHACRLCGSLLNRTFVDLGMSPLCESYVPADKSDEPETFYPLHVRICESCLLVQLPAYVPGEDIFSDYAYFSSYSTSWVEHARRYADTMVEALGLTDGSLVTEVASNDGYLLQHFRAAGVPVLGVEPAANVAEAARAKGIRTVTEFLGAQTGTEIAETHGRADLVAANNVFAHVPDIRGFAAGLRALVKGGGLVTLEFPHLLRLIERRQYDTIYHEHYSYLSLLTASRTLETAGLRITDVEELDTHGGSLRVHARPVEAAGEPSPRVKAVLEAEEAAGLRTVDGHAGFAADVLKIKSDLVGFLLQQAAQGRTVAGYGAPGKGNTLLNHCGIRADLLQYTVDRSPYKQGRLLPGTHIPIHAPERLAQTRPDYVLVLPWNLRDEITEQLSYVRSWGGRLVFPIPSLEIVLRTPVRRSYSRVARETRVDREGVGLMKVVLFCGGLGMRMRDGVTNAPKPMAMIGDRPLMWHVMRYYAHYGHRDFVLCLGYGASAVKDFFLNYDETRSNDFVLEGAGGQVELFRTDISDWRITFVDTGLHSEIGERLRRVRRFVKDEEMFLANYADVFTDAPLPDMIGRLAASDAAVSLLAVPPQSSHHVVDIDDTGLITQVTPVRELRQWENGGYFVLRQEVFDHLGEGEDLVGDAIPRLIARRKVLAYPYKGYWCPADTVKERARLEERYHRGDCPWMVWDPERSGAAAAVSPAAATAATNATTNANTKANTNAVAAERGNAECFR